MRRSSDPYLHTIRRIERGYPDGDFQSDFARGLDEAYKARILAKRMFVNEHFLTLIYRPTAGAADKAAHSIRSEEHTSELQSLMRNSYAVFCLKKTIELKLRYA